MSCSRLYADCVHSDGTGLAVHMKILPHHFQRGGMAVPAGGVHPEAEAGHGHAPHPHLLLPVRTQLPGTHLPPPYRQDTSKYKFFCFWLRLQKDLMSVCLFVRSSIHPNESIWNVKPVFLTIMCSSVKYSLSLLEERKAKTGKGKGKGSTQEGHSKVIYRL